MTFPESAFNTAMTLLRQPRKRRRLARSIAMLLGEEHGAVGQRCSTFSSRELIFSTWLSSSRLSNDETPAVGRGKFRPAAQINRASDFSSGSINHGHALAPSIEREDSRRGRIVDDAIRFLSGGHVGDRLQGFQVDYGDRVGLPVADESAPKLRGDGHSVHTWRFRNPAHHGERIHVENLHLCPMRDVQTAGRLIDREVVKTALAGIGIFFMTE